jgi:hypothetical protein
MKYVFIERERTSRWHAIWPVRVMCKVLAVQGAFGAPFGLLCLAVAQQERTAGKAGA